MESHVAVRDIFVIFYFVNLLPFQSIFATLTKKDTSILKLAEVNQIQKLLKLSQNQNKLR